MTAAVQIYILSRDRPEYVGQTLASALAQDCSEVQIVVSDNSERDDVQALVAREFAGVTYVRREPPMPALEHFRRVIEESSAEFVVLFHDDDVLLPDYASRMLQEMRARPEFAAIGCNAWVLRDRTPTPARFMGSVDRPRRIDTASELLRAYLQLGVEGPAPFPGYMYRRRFLDGLYLDASQGGKHADVTFLTKLLARGPILWLAAPLMQYRFHASNDSRIESVGERLSWLRHMFANDGIDRRSDWIVDFKFYYWARWWAQRSPAGALHLPNGWRERIVLRFLMVTAFRLATTRASFWRRILRRFSRRH